MIYRELKVSFVRLCFNAVNWVTGRVSIS